MRTLRPERRTLMLPEVPSERSDSTSPSPASIISRASGIMTFRRLTQERRKVKNAGEQFGVHTAQPAEVCEAGPDAADPRATTSIP